MIGKPMTRKKLIGIIRVLEQELEIYKNKLSWLQKRAARNSKARKEKK